MRALLEWLRRTADSRAAAWLIFGAALVARLALGFALLHPYAPLTADAAVYDTLARGIVERGAFDDPPGVPTAHRMPGYPLFLAAIHAAGGTDPIVARLVQVLIGATCPVALFLLARPLFGPLAAAIAALLGIVDPFLIFYDYQLWAESLGITTVAWALYYFTARVEPAGSAARYAVCGVLAGVAANFRPDLLFLAPTFACWALTHVRPWRNAVQWCAAMGGTAVLALTPWIARNAITLHHFVPLTTEAGFILWQSNNTDVLYDPDLHGGYVPWPGHPGRDYQEEPNLRQDPRFAGYTDEVDLDRRLRGEVFSFWREHWREMPGFVLGKWTKLLAITPFHAYWPHLFVWVSRIWYSVVLSGFFAGIALALARRRPISLLLWFVGWFLVRIALFMSVFRYRLQVEPLFLLFTGAAVAWLVERFHLEDSGDSRAQQTWIGG